MHQSVSSSSRGVRGIPRISATFFWSVMNRLRPLQLPLESAVLGLELRHARVDGARHRPPAAAPRHLSQRPRLALPPPVRQQRRVQPLATQQGTHLAGLLARIDVLEDAEPIRGGEAPPLDRRRHLRVRGGRAGRGPRGRDLLSPAGLLSLPAPRPRPSPQLLACESSLQPSSPLH